MTVPDRRFANRLKRKLSLATKEISRSTNLLDTFEIRGEEESAEAASLHCDCGADRRKSRFSDSLNIEIVL